MPDRRDQQGERARRWEDGLVPERAAPDRHATGRAPGVRPEHRIRWPGVALVLSAVVALAGLAWQVGVATAGAFGDAAAAGPASVEDVAGGLAGGAMLALLLWLLVAVAASTVAALVPVGRRQVSAVGRLVAPAVVRHLVAALVGVAVVGAGAPAVADTGDVRAVATACAAQQERAVLASRPPDLAARRPTPASSGSLPDGPSAAWSPSEPVVSPGWLPTEPVARPPVRPGADPSVVTSPRRRTTVDVDDEVVVRRGDTLWSVAERHLGPGATAAQVNYEWPRWFAANRPVLTRGPDHLVAGMRLRPPPLLAATGTDAMRAGSPERPR